MRKITKNYFLTKLKEGDWIYSADKVPFGLRKYEWIIVFKKYLKSNERLSIKAKICPLFKFDFKLGNDRINAGTFEERVMPSEEIYFNLMNFYLLNEKEKVELRKRIILAVLDN